MHYIKPLSYTKMLLINELSKDPYNNKKKKKNRRMTMTLYPLSR